MKIVGNTVGTTLPKPNLKQTNPNKGDYVKGKEIIPVKVSQLENDSGYLTEHQDISGKLDANKLPEAVNKALAQAKASGEFNGEPGDDGKSAYEYAQDAGYTGTESEFAQKLAKEDVDWFAKGIAIPENSDLNTYTTLGKYYVQNTRTAATIKNAPTITDNYALFVFQRTQSGAIAQMVVTLTGLIYVRGANESGVFRNWNLSGAGEKGDPGVYTLADGETLADAPEWAQLVVDPNEEPSKVEMVATLADGTTAKYTLYCEAVSE